MLVDDIASALPELQAQAESMMITPCEIRRGGTVDSDDDGADVIVGGTLIYDGGCKVQSREGEVRSPEVGSSTTTIQRWEIHVPVASGPYRIGDVVTALGRTFRVNGLHVKSWQTAQRLPVEEVLL